VKTHLSKKEKKELDRLESEEIARAEQRVLDGEEAEPETAEEFDRLVLASPNSSLCW
jgi:rRNA biogenesis protein RRP5